MRKKINYIKFLLIIVIAVAAGCLLLWIRSMGLLSLEGAREYINSYGSFAVLVFILLFNLRTLFVFFPYSIMVLLGGRIFGDIYGFLISMVCVFSSATAAFYISKLAGKDSVEKLLKGRIKQLDGKIEEHGFKIILLMRISYIFPFDVLSYAAGLTKVKYRHFILATVLGMIPETFSLSMLGHNIQNPFSWNFIVSVGLVFLTIFVPIIVKKVRSSNNKKQS